MSGGRVKGQALRKTGSGELSAYLGFVDDNGLAGLIDAGVIPALSDTGPEGYDLNACRVAVLKHYRKIIAGRTYASDNLAVIKQKKAATDAEKAALELAAFKKELVDATAQRNFWHGIILRVKVKLSAVGPKLAPRLLACTTEGQVEKIIKTELDAVLMDMSRNSG